MKIKNFRFVEPSVHEVFMRMCRVLESYEEDPRQMATFIHLAVTEEEIAGGSVVGHLVLTNRIGVKVAILPRNDKMVSIKMSWRTGEQIVDLPMSDNSYWLGQLAAYHVLRFFYFTSLGGHGPAFRAALAECSRKFPGRIVGIVDRHVLETQTEKISA